MADWTTTTVTTLESEWMRSTTRQRLAACQAVHAPRAVPAVPPMPNFRYPTRATARYVAEGFIAAAEHAAAKRAPWWWPFKARPQAGIALGALVAPPGSTVVLRTQSALPDRSRRMLQDHLAEESKRGNVRFAVFDGASWEAVVIGAPE